jgi:hypothetical protein
MVGSEGNGEVHKREEHKKISKMTFFSEKNYKVLEARIGRTAAVVKVVTPEGGQRMYLICNKEDNE